MALPSGTSRKRIRNSTSGSPSNTYGRSARRRTGPGNPRPNGAESDGAEVAAISRRHPSSGRRLQLPPTSTGDLLVPAVGPLSLLLICVLPVEVHQLVVRLAVYDLLRQIVRQLDRLVGR